MVRPLRMPSTSAPTLICPRYANGRWQKTVSAISLGGKPVSARCARLYIRRAPARFLAAERTLTLSPAPESAGGRAEAEGAARHDRSAEGTRQLSQLPAGVLTEPGVG